MVGYINIHMLYSQGISEQLYVYNPLSSLLDHQRNWPQPWLWSRITQNVLLRTSIADFRAKYRKELIYCR